MLTTQEHQTWVVKLIAWQKQAGRHDLPWQYTQDPYKVWLSEIMLQQTQVATVKAYFERFILRFPSIQSLAFAQQDEVLALWSGLGYYARARNLHKCAQQVVAHYGGFFPEDEAQLIELAGIGRSTAAAIRSLAFNKPAAILDGNVKRVFTRLFGLAGNPNQAPLQNQLWQIAQDAAQCLAQNLAPHIESNTKKTKQQHAKQQLASDAATYTQALMDLGATVCTRSNPNCQQCPLQTECVALQTLQVDQLPSPKPRKITPEKHTHMLLISNANGELFLEKQPSPGIWGGLWCFAMQDAEPNLETLQAQFGAIAIDPLPSFKHTFTHFKLWIHPWRVSLAKCHLAQSNNQLPSKWFSLDDALQAGIPKPVQKLLQQHSG